MPSSYGSVYSRYTYGEALAQALTFLQLIFRALQLLWIAAAPQTALDAFSELRFGIAS